MSKRIITVGSVLLALAGPSAALANGPAITDLRSPDARDAAIHVQPVGVTDLRSPDAQDSSHATSVGQSAPSATGSGDDGSAFPAAFGVVAALGLALGLTLVVSRRRHQRTAVKA